MSTIDSAVNGINRLVITGTMAKVALNTANSVSGVGKSSKRKRHTKKRRKR